MGRHEIRRFSLSFLLGAVSLSACDEGPAPRPDADGQYDEGDTTGEFEDESSGTDQSEFIQGYWTAHETFVGLRNTAADPTCNGEFWVSADGWGNSSVEFLADSPCVVGSLQVAYIEASTGEYLNRNDWYEHRTWTQQSARHPHRIRWEFGEDRPIKLTFCTIAQGTAGCKTWYK